MSFMLSKGKKCICKECGSKIEVLFAGGPRYLQVGDMGVIQQRKLMMKYRTLSDEEIGEIEEFSMNPQFYIVEGGLCRTCFEKKAFDDATMKMHKCVWRIEQLVIESSGIVSKYENRIYEEFMGQYERWLQRIRLSDAAPEIYKQIVEDRRIKEKGIIKSLVNNYLQKNHAIMRERLETEIRTDGSATYSAIIGECNEELGCANTEFVKLKDTLPNDKVIYYWRDTNQGFAENFNPYICYDGSMATIIPGDNTQYYVYSNIAVEEMPATLEYQPNIQSTFFVSDQVLQKDLQRIFVQELRSEVFEGQAKTII